MIKLETEMEVNAIANAMVKYGGSFVHFLGRALHYADLINVARIKKTWPAYWKQYKEMERSTEVINLGNR